VLLRRIIQGAKEHLNPGGLLALEIGNTQGDSVRQLLIDAGYAEVGIEKDLARHDRMAFATHT
jgi:release factor glutamine methyltransferase